MNTPPKGVKSEAKKAEKGLKSEAIEEILGVAQWRKAEHTLRM